MSTVTATSRVAIARCSMCARGACSRWLQSIAMWRAWWQRQRWSGKEGKEKSGGSTSVPRPVRERLFGLRYRSLHRGL